jgi:hypothetical protein
MDGEDVVQDALFEAYRKLGQYDDRRPLARGRSGWRTIDASTSCGGVVSGLRPNLLLGVQIP